MCELLVQIKDTDARNVHEHMWRIRAGDVIVVVPDGHEWGREELRNPIWRVFQLPGVPVGALDEMQLLRPHWKDEERHSAARRTYFDMNDPWLRGLLAAGQVIQFTDVDVARLLGLRRNRTDDLVMVVG